MNTVILKGHLGQDPFIKTFENGGKIASFSLATTDSYTKDGEKVTVTDWHNIVFSGPVCETIGKFLKKGSEVIVTGKIKYRKYEDKDGQTKYITEIKCDRFEFCGKASSDNSTSVDQQVSEKAPDPIPDDNNLPF